MWEILFCHSTSMEKQTFSPSFLVLSCTWGLPIFCIQYTNQFQHKYYEYVQNRFLLLLSKFYPIPNRFIKVVCLGIQGIIPSLDHFCQNFNSIWQFSFSMVVSSLKVFGSGINGSVRLTLLAIVVKVILVPVQTSVGICKQITVVIFYQALGW